MKTLAILTAAALLAGAPAFAQSNTTATTTPLATTTKVDTSTFIKTVPSANEFEIESSKLAEQKATDADVKAFAKQMIADHTKAGEEFKAALAQGQTTSATAPSGPALQPKEQKMLDELKGASGDQFQAKYIEMQTNAHKEAVALFSG
ncbi:DUF4142 domain-containing protein, partial [Mesorhizobium sp. M7A.F.Ca.CA.004.05.2.1]